MAASSPRLDSTTIGTSSRRCTNLPQQFEPLHVWKAEIENDQVGLVGHQIESGLCVWSVDGLIALRAQSHAQQFADRRLVIDHEDLERGRAHAAVSKRSVGFGMGSVMVNTAPGRSDRFAAVDGPAHGLDEAARNGEPKSGAGTNLILLLRAVELIEDAIEILWR